MSVENTYIARCGQPLENMRDGKQHEANCDDCKHAIDPDHPPTLSDLESEIIEQVSKVRESLPAILATSKIILDREPSEVPGNFLLCARIPGDGIHAFTVRALVEIEVRSELVSVPRSHASAVAEFRIELPAAIELITCKGVQIWPDDESVAVYGVYWEHVRNVGDYVKNLVSETLNEVRQHFISLLTDQQAAHILSDNRWQIRIY